MEIEDHHVRILVTDPVGRYTVDRQASRLPPCLLAYVVVYFCGRFEDCSKNRQAGIVQHGSESCEEEVFKDGDLTWPVQEAEWNSREAP